MNFITFDYFLYLLRDFGDEFSVGKNTDNE